MYLGSYVCKTSDVYPLSFFHVETLDIDKTANCRVVVDHAVNSVFVRIGFFRLDSWWWGGTAVLVFFSCTGYIACQLLLWWTCWNAVFKDLYRMVGHTWRKTEMVHDVNFFPINWNKCYRTTRCEVKLLRERVFNIDRCGFRVMMCRETALVRLLMNVWLSEKSMEPAQYDSTRNLIKVPNAVETTPTATISTRKRTRTWTRTRTAATK